MVAEELTTIAKGTSNILLPFGKWQWFAVIILLILTFVLAGSQGMKTHSWKPIGESILTKFVSPDTALWNDVNKISNSENKVFYTLSLKQESTEFWKNFQSNWWLFLIWFDMLINLWFYYLVGWMIFTYLVARFIDLNNTTNYLPGIAITIGIMFLLSIGYNFYVLSSVESKDPMQLTISDIYNKIIPGRGLIAFGNYFYNVLFVPNYLTIEKYSSTILNMPTEKNVTL